MPDKQKMTPQETSDLVMRHNAALLAHMATRGVALAVIGEKGEYIDLGSGTCVRIDGRHFVATAAHVIAPYTSERIILIRSGMPTSSPTPFCGRGSRGGEQRNPIDIAWLEIPASHASTLGKDFVELDRLLPGCATVTNDVVFAYGNPDALIPEEAKRKKRLPVQPIGYSTVTIASPSRQRAPKEILIEYARKGNVLADGTPFELPEPHGISGGSIWKMNVTKPGLWSPYSCHLIGVSHTYLRRKRQVQGTQIQHWLEMVAEDLPELAGTIRPVLAQAAPT